MNQITLDRLIEAHRKEIAMAGKDVVRIMAANKKFWAKKLGYLQNGRPLNEAFLFNDRTTGSYHPWSSLVLGEAFGDAGLKELIDPLDYLHSSPLIDDFLEGMAVGMKKAATRKAKHIKDMKTKKGRGGDPTELAEMALKGGKE